MSGAPSSRWWLVRHGPVPCPQGRIHGQLDVACDVSDHEDIRQLAGRLPSQATLVESGLIRCRQTSGALEAAGLALPPGAMERLSLALGERDILAVVHAGTIRAALALALGLEPAQALRFAVQPLSLTRVDRISAEWRVECVNVTAW